MHEEMPRIVKGLGDYYPSMAQDAQAHRQTEVDSLTGAISMFGRKVGVPTHLRRADKGDKRPYRPTTSASIEFWTGPCKSGPVTI